MAPGIKSFRNAGDHQGSALGQLQAKALGHSRSILSMFPGSYHRDGRFLVKQEALSFPVQHSRRVGQLAQALRIGCILKGHNLHAKPLAVLQDFLGLVHTFLFQPLELARGQRELSILLPAGVIDPFRGNKVIQQQLDFSRRDPLAAGQPKPVFQLCHFFIPRPKFLFTNGPIHGMVNR